MYLRSGFCPKPQARGELTLLPWPLAGGQKAHCTLPKTPPLSRFSVIWASGVPQKRHRFREQSKLLQRVHFTEKVEKHCTIVSVTSPMADWST